MSEVDTAPAQAPPPSVRRAATRGMVWTGSQALLGRLLSLASFVVLTRYLSVQDYGVATLANVFIAFLTLFAAAGYSAALVQQPEIEKEDLDTIFWIGLGTSVVLALAMVGAAWPLAAVFDEPRLRPVLQALAPVFIFVALGSTHQAILQRELDFKRIAMANLGANLVATTVGVVFAIVGFGVWSIVVQILLMVSLTTAGLALRTRYVPSPRVSWARFAPLFAFSRNQLGSSLIGWLNSRTDDFLIGAYLGTAVLGVYTVGYRVLTVMNEVLTSSIGKVAFSSFARMQGDRERLVRGYRTATGIGVLVSVPAFMFCLGAAPQIVRFVFGSKWEASIPVMQILCLFGAVNVIQSFNGALLVGIGRPKTVFRVGVAGTVLQVIGFALTVSHGIQWVAVSFVVRAYLILPVGVVIAARALQTTVRETLSDTVRPILCSLLMVGGVLAARAEGVDDLPPGLGLLALGLVAAVLYGGSLYLFGGRVLAEFTRDVRDAYGARLRRALPTWMRARRNAA